MPGIWAGENEMKTKDQKREEARIRQEKYLGLSVQQRISRLDTILGKGLGARRERARLAEVK